MENQVNTEAEKIFNIKQSEGKMKLSILPEIVLQLELVDSAPVVTFVCLELVKKQHVLTNHLGNISCWIDSLKAETSIIEICKAAEYGNSKYGRCNWKLGSKWSIYVDACLRHMLAFLDNKTYDSDSNCHHLAHAIMNLGILHYYISNEIGENDLKLVDSTPKVQ